MTEEKLHKQIVDYIKAQYSNIVFNTDMSGIKLTKGQASKAKELRSDNGFPDIVIYEPQSDNSYPWETYNGLFLEVKKETPYRKDGKLHKMTRYKTVGGIKVPYDHLKRQSELHERLEDRNFMCRFVWSFEMAKELIDDYLK